MIINKLKKWMINRHLTIVLEKDRASLVYKNITLYVLLYGYANIAEEFKYVLNRKWKLEWTRNDIGDIKQIEE